MEEPMTLFAQFQLTAPILSALERLGISVPTPVQQETIPLAMAGGDVLASAQTGSGKTVAYLVPLLMKLMADPQAAALILAPTRELAMQVYETLQKVGQGSPVLKAALLIGGASMFNQLRDLRKGARVIVGTPGRINDHLERGSLRLNQTRFLVIDEGDRMLDMGFGVQLDQIAKHLPEKRQTLLFSATIPQNIERLAKKYLTHPHRIAITTSQQEAPKITQESRFVHGGDKKQELLKELSLRDGSIIVFVKTRRKADHLATDLYKEGHEAAAIHGDLRQRKRDQVIRAFRQGDIRILVATDVAARGLDIPDVKHVINNDLPDAPEDYIHRIGRTGRAGKEGKALSFISPDEKHKWRAIERLLDPTKKLEAPKPFSAPKPGGFKPKFGPQRKKNSPFNFKKRRSFSSFKKK
jgi:superfamily II DNA/RNA helicase